MGVAPTVGHRFFRELPYLDAENLRLFINIFAQAFSDRLNLILLNTSRAHAAQRHTLPQEVRLVFPAPYRPELRPIAQIYCDLKEALV